MTKMNWSRGGAPTPDVWRAPHPTWDSKTQRERTPATLPQARFAKDGISLEWRITPQGREWAKWRSGVRVLAVRNGKPPVKLIIRKVYQIGDRTFATFAQDNQKLRNQ